MTEEYKKKILILFCGGSISMHKNEKTGALDIAHGADQFFKLEPRIVEIASIATRFIDNIDSTDLGKPQWEKLIDAIKEEYDNYDGFVITIGTNTMAYTSAALSFGLEQIGKPVILTGAQIPAEIISTDGRNNIVNALRVATMDLSGVYIVFGSKIILGCRAKKISESRLDAFGTFQASDIGEISVGIKIDKNAPKRNDKPIVIKNGFDDNIVSITLVPGLKADNIKLLIDRGVKGIVLRAYGSGDIPHCLHETLAYAQQKEVPILITTQCPGGATAIGLNSVGLETLKLDVIQVFDMCMEAMTTKLMWLLHQQIHYSEMKRLIQTNIRGEVDTTMAQILLNQYSIDSYPAIIIGKLKILCL